jgi:hypothetical protein
VVELEPLSGPAGVAPPASAPPAAGAVLPPGGGTDAARPAAVPVTPAAPAASAGEAGEAGGVGEPAPIEPALVAPPAGAEVPLL